MAAGFSHLRLHHRRRPAVLRPQQKAKPARAGPSRPVSSHIRPGRPRHPGTPLPTLARGSSLTLTAGQQRKRPRWQRAHHLASDARYLQRERQHAHDNANGWGFDYLCGVMARRG